MKKKEYQQLILKLSSNRILKASKKLHITLKEARQNDELVSLGDSNCLRMIDKLNGVDRASIMIKVKSLRKRMNKLKKQPKSIENKKEIRSIYKILDELQFKPEYISIIMDKMSDFDKLNKGFKINDIEYRRLVGTTNGVKKSTVVYCAVKNKQGIEVYRELSKRMDNDRNLDKELVGGKFEAYKSLTCSASTPVSNPNGILVVDDVITRFNEDVIVLDDSIGSEPVLSYKNEEIELIDSDGYGLMSLALALRWSEELELDYLCSGMCIRNAFCKGMLFTFDFHEFAKRYSKNGIVTDVWGHDININDVEMVLTTSMLKLWDSYESIEHYLSCCEENDYTFAITKPCPKELEDERTLNYQFIQSYKLSNDDIQELIFPTVKEIKNILHNNIDKAVIFMGGGVSDEDNIHINDNIVKALMIDKRMLNDPFVINRINHLIKKKMDDAKIGVLKVRGNYAVISGDPYALCQHIFKTNVDSNGNDISSELGLLKANEMYSKYWIDKSVNEVLCFRAPMSCHNNIRKAKITYNAEMDFWYQYMTTVNILSCHDSITMAENGSDKDGDCYITTDNSILLSKLRDTKVINCIQRKANKHQITEDVLVESNKNGFGNGIGSITNRVTAMYSVQAQFKPDSKEYQILDYRIMCGQLAQQNEIDKIKGIISNQMPKSWYENKENRILPNDTKETVEKKKLYSKIVADKKPYFMIYIYPQLKAEYKKYINSAEKKCRIEFSENINELIKKKNKTEKEKDFLKWYDKKIPVEMHNCTMNKVCCAVEKEFDSCITKIKAENPFDYSILKSHVDYDIQTYYSIKKIYDEYTAKLQAYIIKTAYEKIDVDESNITKAMMQEEYKQKCEILCTNKYELCDIILDICYRKEYSKKFAWDICGDTIIENLLRENNNQISYYIKNTNGNIQYLSEKYIKKIKNMEGI